MSIKLVAGIILGLLVVGGGTYAVVTRTDTPQEETNTDVQADTKTSIETLIVAGIPQQCTFIDATAAGEVSGTVYIADWKVRGDFAANVQGKTYHAHSIMDGTHAYSWVDETNIGVKSTLATSETSGGSSIGVVQALNTAKSLEYRCTPWVPDTSKFEVPTTINFMTAPVSGSGSASICAQCDIVPEAYRAQCRVAAGC